MNELFKGETNHSELNLGTELPQGVEGYWRKVTKKCIEKYPFVLPFPVAFDVEGYDKNAFADALSKLENHIAIRSYKTPAQHRWTGHPNGKLEYQSQEWRWPSGYIEYIKAGVPPSRNFYRYVMKADLPNLPEYHSCIE